MPVATPGGQSDNLNKRAFAAAKKKDAGQVKSVPIGLGRVRPLSRMPVSTPPEIETTPAAQRISSQPISQIQTAPKTPLTKKKPSPFPPPQMPKQAEDEEKKQKEENGEEELDESGDFTEMPMASTPMRKEESMETGGNSQLANLGEQGQNKIGKGNNLKHQFEQSKRDELYRRQTLMQQNEEVNQFREEQIQEKEKEQENQEEQSQENNADEQKQNQEQESEGTEQEDIQEEEQQEQAERISNRDIQMRRQFSQQQQQQRMAQMQIAAGQESQQSQQDQAAEAAQQAASKAKDKLKKKIKMQIMLWIGGLLLAAAPYIILACIIITCGVIIANAVEALDFSTAPFQSMIGGGSQFSE